MTAVEVTSGTAARAWIAIDAGRQVDARLPRRHADATGHAATTVVGRPAQAAILPMNGAPHDRRNSTAWSASRLTVAGMPRSLSRSIHSD
jgi:hypothetical protein